MSRIQSETIIEKIIAHYEPYFKKKNNNLLLTDPNDKRVIGFHYGETHLGTAMIIWGTVTKNNKMVEIGQKVIEGFLAHAVEYQKNPAYHWDFNNFALCILVNYLDGSLKNVRDEMKSQNTERNKVFCDKIRSFLIIQQDSKNPTINWLPMRMYFNYCKNLWTGDSKSLKVMDRLSKKIQSAQYKDGFYEDLLPKGKSFNFQYHIYTTAVLHFLETQGIRKVENKKAVQQAVSVVDPSGDVNYLGRGINQIFAWGPALYLFQSINADEALLKAESYFEGKIGTAIDNDNLILNNLLGSQKSWWWDYHYASVYFAHLVFWLVLAQILKDKSEHFVENEIIENDSGVHIIETENFKVCIFDGRKDYLAEKGPLVANICEKNGRYVFKGAFGPFAGNYGNQYGIPSQTIHNYFGVIQEKIFAGFLGEKPIICKLITVDETEGKLKICLDLGRQYKGVRINLPLLCNHNRVTVISDGKKQLLLRDSGMVVGAYGMTKLYVTNSVDTRLIEIQIDN